MPAPGQQQGIGGFLQGSNGKMAIGALGGVAAVLGGGMLLQGIENKIEDDIIERGHRHHRDEGPLDGLAELGNDIGLF
jgi:hypothetical protein